MVRFVRLAALLMCVGACGGPPPEAPLPGPALSTVVWTEVPVATAPAPTAQVIIEATPSAWETVAPGFERRELSVAIPDTGLTETLILFRVHPVYAHFHVHYTPGQAQFVSNWARELDEADPIGPLLVFNAAFFDEDYRVTAFTVADGNVDGVTYEDFGGMFSVQNGVARVRSLTLEPWQREEVFSEAVQGTPVLVRPGGSPFSTPDAQRSRRTAIAQTSTGEIVIVVAPHYTLRLVELAAALLDPGLDLAIALNLDGGSSTGYWAGPADWVDSDKPIPAVIAVYPN